MLMIVSKLIIIKKIQIMITIIMIIIKTTGDIDI